MDANSTPRDLIACVTSVKKLILLQIVLRTRAGLYTREHREGILLRTLRRGWGGLRDTGRTQQLLLGGLPMSGWTHQAHGRLRRRRRRPQKPGRILLSLLSLMQERQYPRCKLPNARCRAPGRPGLHCLNRPSAADLTERLQHLQHERLLRIGQRFAQAQERARRKPAVVVRCEDRQYMPKSLPRRTANAVIGVAHGSRQRADAQRHAQQT